MSVTPTAGPAKTLDYLETLIAGCDECQDWIEEARNLAADTIDSDGAKAYIHRKAVEVEEGGDWTAVRPFWILSNRERRLVGNSNVYAGDCQVIIESDVPAEYANDIEDAEAWFDNHVGALVDEMRSDSHTDTTGTKLYIREIEIEETWRSDENEEATDGDYYAAVLRVAWGPEE